MRSSYETGFTSHNFSIRNLLYTQFSRFRIRLLFDLFRLSLKALTVNDLATRDISVHANILIAHMYL